MAENATITPAADPIKKANRNQQTQQEDSSGRVMDIPRHENAKAGGDTTNKWRNTTDGLMQVGNGSYNMNFVPVRVSKKLANGATLVEDVRMSHKDAATHTAKKRGLAQPQVEEADKQEEFSNAGSQKQVEGKKENPANAVDKQTGKVVASAIATEKKNNDSIIKKADVVPVVVKTVGNTLNTASGVAAVKSTATVTTVSVNTKSTDKAVPSDKQQLDDKGEKKEEPKAEEPAKVKALPKPEDDPGYQAIIQQVNTAKKTETQHPDVQSRVTLAKKASQIDPLLEKKSLAGQKQVGVMSDKPVGKFDAAVFTANLLGSIEHAIPDNKDDAVKFKDANKLGDVKKGVKTDVATGEAQADGGVKEATKQPLDIDKEKVAPAVPLNKEDTGAKPEVKHAEQAVPKPKDDADISMEKEAAEPDNKMAASGVTDSQLAESNEPTFTAALDSKNKAKSDAQNAPAQYRLVETPMLDGARKDATADVGKTMAAFFGVKSNAFGAVNTGKGKAKTADEQVRQKVATQMKDMYEGTKARVTAILDKLDADVNTEFETTVNQANKTFETNVGAKLDKSTWDSIKDWLKSHVLGLPVEVRNIFAEEKQKFLNTVTPMITRLGNRVEKGLTDATEEIKKGKADLDNFWKSQTPETKKVAADAYSEISGKYTELETQVQNKQNELIDSLTQKYVAAVKQLQETFDKIKKEKQTWLDAAIASVEGAIDTISNFKKMLLQTLSRVAEAISEILAHPIDFLKNMVNAVGQGLSNFATNITKHLKTGFFDWLFGVIPAGVKFPDKWDLPGIFHFVMQFFELTWDAIKAKVTKLVGKPVSDALETAFDIFQTIKKDGIVGLWNYVKDKVGDLQTMVIDAMMSMLESEVVQAGIKWIMKLLTPAGAFVAACQAIYDIIIWFVNNGKRIMDLVNSIIDSVTLIVAGKLDDASAKVETSLANIIPISIGFLAGLIGLGDMGKKIQEIIGKIRAPIEKAIDWVVDKAVAFAYQLGIPQMIEKGVNVVKGKVGDKPKQEGSDERTLEQKQKSLDEGVQAGTTLLKSDKHSRKEVNEGLEHIKTQYRLKELVVKIDKHEDGSDLVHIHGEVNPSKDSEKVKMATALSMPFKKGDYIKAKYIDGFWVARITDITEQIVYISFEDNRKGKKEYLITEFKKEYDKGEVKEYIPDKRQVFMGANPDRDGPVGEKVRKKMGSLYKKEDSSNKEKIKNGITWYDIEDCDLSHEPVDAVTYWNTEGYKYGAQSLEVRKWMNDYNNYIFEPASINRSRGARNREEYRIPLKDI